MTEALYPGAMELGPQFRYPKSADDEDVSEHVRDQFRHVHELHGAGTVEVAFGDHPKTVAPWPRGPRTKTNPRGYDKDRVTAELQTPPRLHAYDPRQLHATQNEVTREGVSHYLGRQFNVEGATFRDHDNPGNAYPVVYEKESGHRLLLSGHHRAMASLLRGEDLLARRVQGP